MPTSPRDASLRFKGVTTLIGISQLGLAVAVAARNDKNASYNLGAIMGGTVIWPLIIIGLFALSRNYRTVRTRLTICVVIWGLFCLGHLGNLSKPVQGPRADARNSAAEVVPKTAPETSVNSVGVATPTVLETPPETSAAEVYDFTSGSDERLIGLIDGAQKDRYREIVGAYTRACDRRPQDARLALERVRFIEHFAYSEDLQIEEATTDLEEATQYLTTRFADVPGTILHQLRQVGYEEVETSARSYEPRIGRWEPAEQAEFWLLRAQAADSSQQPAALEFARESFALNPTPTAGLLLAEKTHESRQHRECLQTLTHSVFADATAWVKKQKLDLLLKIKESRRAGELYEELKAAEPQTLLDPQTAAALAANGLVAQARESFANLDTNEWNRRRSSLRRFAFELTHGTASQAEDAYRAMRSSGLTADPFWRYRYELFRRHPRAAWNGEDFAGLCMLGLICGAMAALPLALVLPVHYWSLLRNRKGKAGGWLGALWGLRQGGLMMALMFVTSLAAIWFMKPEEMRSWFTGQGQATDVIVPPSLLVVQSAIWVTTALIVGALFWRARAWRLFGPGQWPVGRCIGIGLLATLGLRILLTTYLRFWPAAATGEMTAALTQTNQLFLDLMKIVGPFGFLAVVALFVPLLEEALCRGVLLQALGKHVPFFWANAGQAVVFSLMHENYRLIPFYFAMGFACGELTRRSGGLLPALIVHVCNNTVAALGIIYLHRAGA